MSKIQMLHEKDPKQAILDDIGDVLDDLTVLNTQVLVGVYVRPEKTAGGVFLTRKAREEDQFQSKVGLILKKGPTAFVEDPDNPKWFGGVKFNEHDWVVFRPSDGWPVTINGVLCRMIEDVSVKIKSEKPDSVF